MVIEIRKWLSGCEKFTRKGYMGTFWATDVVLYLVLGGVYSCTIVRTQLGTLKSVPFIY